MYQSEFPVDQPVPVYDPTLWFALILACLAIAALAFYAGRLTVAKRKSGDDSKVPETIHKAIQDKCKEASSAHSGELLVKTLDLIAELTRRIGPLLRFGELCADTFQVLQLAVVGEVPNPEGHDAHGHDDHGHDEHHDDHGDGHGHKPKGDSLSPEHGKPHDKGRGGVEVLSRNVTIVGSQTVLFAKEKSDHGADDHGHGKKPKAMDHKAFTQNLRLAVAAFSDAWNQPETLATLKACRDALTETQPLPKPKTGTSRHD
ncbi:hypothetical protein [Caulobacter sp. RHG1]|uniref:hypothetical protein n=1 Tax=Caulobacter sp. (strain RHG1) TaxID=2545762 RepID=UPI0015521770|nr:hypothetical protein [Caulobacter sp. RHG1]